MQIFWSEMNSPVGTILLAASSQGLCHLSYQRTEQPERELQHNLSRWFPENRLKQDSQALSQMINQVKEYFNKQRGTFDLPLDLAGTPFQKQVWEELRKIPYGKLRSYSEIAKAIGNPKAVRAVGGANNKNPVSIIVPCHRVVGANHALIGYGGGVHRKKFLLEHEGIILEK